MSRTVERWCEKTPTDEDRSTDHERDDFGGLPEGQLDAVRGIGKSKSKTPADAHQDANKCA